MTGRVPDPRGKDAPELTYPEDTVSQLRYLFLEVLLECVPEVGESLWVEFRHRGRFDNYPLMINLLRREDCKEDISVIRFDRFPSWIIRPEVPTGDDHQLVTDLRTWANGWNLNFPFVLEAMVNAIGAWSDTPDFSGEEGDEPWRVWPVLIADGGSSCRNKFIFQAEWQPHLSRIVAGHTNRLLVGGSRNEARKALHVALDEYMDRVEQAHREAGLTKPRRSRTTNKTEETTPHDRMRWLVWRIVPIAHSGKTLPPGTLSEDAGVSKAVFHETTKRLANEIGVKIPRSKRGQP